MLQASLAQMRRRWALKVQARRPSNHLVIIGNDLIFDDRHLMRVSSSSPLGIACSSPNIRDEECPDSIKP